MCVTLSHFCAQRPYLFKGAGDIYFLAVPHRRGQYLSDAFGPMIFFLAEVITGWRSALQCNCIVGGIFNHLPWKSTLQFSRNHPETLRIYFLGTNSKSWTKQNFDLCLYTENIWFWKCWTCFFTNFQGRWNFIVQ